MRYNTSVQYKNFSGDGAIEINGDEIVVFKKSAAIHYAFGAIGTALAQGKEVVRFSLGEIKAYNIIERLFGQELSITLRNGDSVVVGIKSDMWGSFLPLIKQSVAAGNADVSPEHSKKVQEKDWEDKNLTERGTIDTAEQKEGALEGMRETEKKTDHEIAVVNSSCCAKCGKEIPGDSAFCPFCGNEIKNIIEAETATICEQASDKKKSTTIPNNPDKNVDSPIKPATKSRRGAVVAIVLLSVILLALAGLNIYQHTELQKSTDTIQKYSATIKDKSTEIASLKKANEKLEKEKEAAVSAKNAAITEKNKAVKQNQTFTTIKNWVEKYSKSFRSHSTYYAASNVIAVKVGETVELSITYTGSRHVWKGMTGNACKAEWSKQWSSHTTSVKITGVSAGTSEISFYLGDSTKADSQESFRVLVIVV